MNKLERARFDLEMILPYVKHLRKQVKSLGTHEPDKPELCFKGEVGGHFQTLQEIPQDQEIVLFEPKKVI